MKLFIPWRFFFRLLSKQPLNRRGHWLTYFLFDDCGVVLLYKDHAIIAAAKRDEKTGKYKPVVHISWQALDGRRENYRSV